MQEFQLENGHKYPVTDIEGDFSIGSSVSIKLETKPPIDIEARVEAVDRGFAGIILARAALDLAGVARLNVSKEKPHKGTATILL